ncbi:MAG: transcriptional regulator [Candidatus Saccharibacteria bacterium]
MIEQLFGSKTRVKLLQLFYQNPNRSFYVREITRKIDEQINSVRRELANLLSIGIITSDTNNNRLYYEVSQTYEHYPALSSIFGGKKFKASKKDKASKETTDEAESADVEPTENIKDPFVADLLKAGNIRLAIYTGQFTRDDQSGVDILIVGDVNRSAIDNLVADLEISEKKDLRYSVFAPEEFKYRKQVNDRFISDILVSKKIVLIDKDKIL